MFKVGTRYCTEFLLFNTIFYTNFDNFDSFDSFDN